MVAHLYVHIPFCPKICPYCNFYKEVGRRELVRPLLDGILREAEREATGLRPVTIFFGGGTPTALSTSQLEELITGLRQRIDFSALSEFTLEMNPATVSLEKATALRALGVNRVSMGVQSWNDRHLQALGRVHSAAQARRSFGILREAGFENLNLDLMFGIPGQSAADWESSLRTTMELGPEHISAYCLTYEEDTEYFRRFQNGEFAPDEERDVEFFETAMRCLPQAGYSQYEISNHAHPGRECLHNLAYWNGCDYVGLGPSAFSTRDGVRRRNVCDTRAYAGRILSGVSAADFVEEVPPELRMVEQNAFALRTRSGVSASSLPMDKVRQLVREGLLILEDGRAVLTGKGKLVADAVAAELI